MTPDRTPTPNGSHSQSPQSRFALAEEEFYDLVNRSPIEPRILVEQCFGDVPFALSLLEEFVTILADRRDKLVQAAHEANFTQLAMLAHALKGAAGYAAASRLSQLCAHLEDVVASHDLAQTWQHLHNVSSEITRCVQEFPNISRKMSSATT